MQKYILLEVPISQLQCVGLSQESDPEIFDAVRFGAVLENVVFHPDSRVVDYNDTTLTQNTRCAYPIEYITNVKVPCITESHPTNIIFLTCDARGVLPLVSKLDTNQLMYYFITGYTSKVAGTEAGVDRPEVTFSACFGQPFLVLRPTVYASMLANKIVKHQAKAWLVNTGWTGNSVGKGGKRCPLEHTRAILNAIHDGSLASVEYENFPVFNLSIPVSCPGVPTELLNPAKSWQGTATEFQTEVVELARLFKENFVKFHDQRLPEVEVQTAIEIS